MRVSDEHVAALRAYLEGDLAGYERTIGALQRHDDVDGFAVIATTAFVEAVRRRFEPGWKRGDVVRFVAGVRARWGGATDQIDPLDAEILVRAALGDERPDDLDDTAKAAQIHLLTALISDENPDRAGMDRILTRAREQAARIPG